MNINMKGVKDHVTQHKMILIMNDNNLDDSLATALILSPYFLHTTDHHPAACITRPGWIQQPGC